MSTIDVNKTYTISGQTLQDLVDAIDNLKSVSGVQVANMPTALEGVQGRDWKAELVGAGMTGTFPTTFLEPPYISQGLEWCKDWMPDQDPGIWYKNEAGPDITFYYGSSTSLFNKMTNEFENCRALEYAYITTLGNNTNISGMFQGCTSLKDVYIPSTETIKVTAVGNMFAGCRSLTDLPNLSFTNVTSAKGMLQACYGLFYIGAMDKVLQMCINFDCTGILEDIFGGFDEKRHAWVNTNLSSCPHYSNFLSAGWRVFTTQS